MDTNDKIHQKEKNTNLEQQFFHEQRSGFLFHIIGIRLSGAL